MNLIFEVDTAHAHLNDSTSVIELLRTEISRLERERLSLMLGLVVSNIKSAKETLNKRLLDDLRMQDEQAK